MVKAIGLYIAVYGFLYVFDGLLLALGLGSQHQDSKYWLYRGIIGILFGFLIIRGYPPFVEFAFPQPPPEIEKESRDTQPSTGQD